MWDRTNGIQRWKYITIRAVRFDNPRFENIRNDVDGFSITFGEVETLGQKMQKKLKKINNNNI